LYWINPLEKEHSKHRKQGNNIVKGQTESMKEIHRKQKDFHHDKQKVPESGTHPLERHSGTGLPAYGNKEKKSGAGAYNWGKSTDVRIMNDDDLEEVEQGETISQNNLPISGQAMTMDEYQTVVRKSSFEVVLNDKKKVEMAEGVKIEKVPVDDFAAKALRKKSSDSQKPKVVLDQPP
jgi:hypothetical protein